MNRKEPCAAPREAGRARTIRQDDPDLIIGARKGSPLILGEPWSHVLGLRTPGLTDQTRDETPKNVVSFVCFFPCKEDV